jgi:hypothetical protein
MKRMATSHPFCILREKESAHDFGEIRFAHRGTFSFGSRQEIKDHHGGKLSLERRAYELT